MQESLHHDDPEQLLAQGIEAVKAGDRSRARELLGQAIQLNPADERIWLWMSGAVETDHDRQRCLERVLQINPRNEAARRGLAAIVSVASLPPAAAPPMPAWAADPPPDSAASSSPAAAPPAVPPMPAWAADPPPASAAPMRSPLDTSAAPRHEPAAHTLPEPRSGVLVMADLAKLREATQPAPSRRFRPLVLVLLVVIAVIVVLAVLFALGYLGEIGG
jgi:hypothetical protein